MARPDPGAAARSEARTGGGGGARRRPGAPARAPGDAARRPARGGRTAVGRLHGRRDRPPARPLARGGPQGARTGFEGDGPAEGARGRTGRRSRREGAVSDEPDLQRQLALDRFWDDVVAGGRARAADPDLDPALAEAIRRLQLLDT